MGNNLRKHFIIETGDNIGDNWFMAFGDSCIDNKKYSVATNYKGSWESQSFIKDAKTDSELVCHLLNMYFNGLIKIPLEIKAL